MKIYTMKKILFSILTIGFTNISISQTVIAHWDFNSVPSDASTSTGSNLPIAGTGTITNIGAVTNTFAAGTTTDPNTTDNTAYNSTNYPAQGLNPKTAGIQIDFSTVGLTNIALTFEQRMSNTAANTWVLQYTLDRTVGLPTWTDAQTFTFVPASTGTGSVWYQRSYNFSAITGLNNNANAAFRIVSNFDPNSGTYLASASTSTYGAGGTSRFDLVNISSLPSIQPYILAFIGADKTVNESVATTKVRLKVTSAGNVAGSIDFLASSYSNANASDYTVVNSTLTVSDTLVVNDTISFDITINDDSDIESDEYIICKLANGVNVNFASTAQYTLFIKDNDRVLPVANNQLTLNVLGSFSNGAFASNSAEISVYDSLSKRIFVANSIGSKLDIVDFSNPTIPSLEYSINISAYGAINSVAVKNGIIALAIENSVNAQDSGKVVFLDTNGVFISQVNVGIQPDMIVFNHAGTKVYTANEAQPSDDYLTDPDGSISVIDVSGTIATLTASNVSHITFTSFNGQETLLKSQGVRIFGLSGMASKDFEPEYITIADDDSKAWVTLQENNALAELNLLTNSVTRIIPLGFKNHNSLTNGLDASDVTSDVNISNFPVKGMYLPDAISHYTSGGNIYLLTANEGDSRAYAGMNEETTIGNGSYVLDPTVFPNGADLKNNSVLGKLKTTNKLGDTDNDGDFDEIYVYGARSFSVWDANTANLVFDSGDDLEQITSTHPTYSTMFNASNGTGITKKNRSDDKGPEPEGVATGNINGHEYAFIALERIGGVMVYDITNPVTPSYVTYINNRGPDRGSEGIIFISAAESPNGKNLIILSNETSSTLTIIEVNACLAPALANIANDGSLGFCAGDSVKLYNANSGPTNNYQWLLNGNNISGATDSVIFANQAGNYSLYAFDANGCENTSSALATQTAALPMINVTTSSATTFCDTDSLILSDVTTPNYTYQWINGTSVVSSATDTSLIIFASGNYALIATNNGICSDTSSFTSVTVNNSPAIPTVSQTGLTLTCTTTGVQYQWYFEGNLISGATAQDYTATANGVYNVEITNGNSCSTISADITVNTVGLKNIASKNESIISPNPTDGQIKIAIELENKSIISIGLYDVMGKKIDTILTNKEINARENFMYTLPATLSNGVYFIKTSGVNVEKTTRVVLHR